jgi:hypothetical protein
MADDPGQAIPKKGSRKGHRRQIPWRRDSVIMARLPQVERLHLAGRKVLGLVIDKQELSGANGGAVPIRIVEVIPPDGGDGGNAPD